LVATRKPISVDVIFAGSIAKEIFGEEHMVVLLEQGEATLEGLVDKLDKKQEGKISQILHSPNISILLNGQDIEFLKDKNPILHEGDRIAIIPLVAGG
jgi:molybdopterin converting factor small subunit